MFGKKSSAGAKFVMSMGRKVGNLKAPLKAKMEMEPSEKPKNLPMFDSMKAGVKTNQNPPQSKGKANTFKTK